MADPRSHLHGQHLPLSAHAERDGGDKNGSWILPSGPLVLRLPMLAENIPSKSLLPPPSGLLRLRRCFRVCPRAGARQRGSWESPHGSAGTPLALRHLVPTPPQVQAINVSSRFEEEIKAEQEERKKQAEEMKQRKAAFKELQSTFK